MKNNYVEDKYPCEETINSIINIDEKGSSIMNEESSQASGYTTSIIDNKHIHAFTISKEGEPVSFIAGQIDKNILFNNHQLELLIRAINNRTRERNYFRLYCQLLEKEINDDDFDKEIDDHEDDYVTTPNHKATKDDIQFAFEVSSKIKDIKDASDIIDLFSFSDSSIQKYIK